MMPIEKPKQEPKQKETTPLRNSEAITEEERRESAMAIVKTKFFNLYNIIKDSDDLEYVDDYGNTITIRAKENESGCYIGVYNGNNKGDEIFQYDNVYEDVSKVGELREALRESEYRRIKYDLYALELKIIKAKEYAYRRSNANKN